MINGGNLTETVYKCRSLFGYRNAPTRNVVVNFINKFQSAGSLLKKTSGRTRTVQMNLLTALSENLSVSMRRSNPQ